MSENKNIRVCLKCRSYIIIFETAEGKKRLERFNLEHLKHTLITAPYREKDNLECGKVICEDTDEKKPLKHGI